MKHRAFAFLLFLSLLASCVGLDRDAPEKRYYVLDVERSEVLPFAPDGGVLKIGRFDISPRYAGKGFVYRTGPSQYEPDYYHEFLVAPEELIVEEVRDWLSDCGSYAGVSSGTGPAVPCDILHGTVNSLYGDARRPGELTGVLEIQFNMILGLGSPHNVHLAHIGDYRREVVAEGSTPDALVAAWNEALGQILGELEQDLIRYAHDAE